MRPLSTEMERFIPSFPRSEVVKSLWLTGIIPLPLPVNFDVDIDAILEHPFISNRQL
jgi:hypothetical protein